MATKQTALSHHTSPRRSSTSNLEKEEENQKDQELLLSLQERRKRLEHDVIEYNRYLESIQNKQLLIREHRQPSDYQIQSPINVQEYQGEQKISSKPIINHLKSTQKVIQQISKSDIESPKKGEKVIDKSKIDKKSINSKTSKRKDTEISQSKSNIRISECSGVEIKQLSAKNKKQITAKPHVSSSKIPGGNQHKITNSAQQGTSNSNLSNISNPNNSSYINTQSKISRPNTEGSEFNNLLQLSQKKEQYPDKWKIDELKKELHLGQLSQKPSRNPESQFWERLIEQRLTTEEARSVIRRYQLKQQSDMIDDYLLNESLRSQNNNRNNSQYVSTEIFPQNNRSMQCSTKQQPYLFESLQSPVKRNAETIKISHNDKVLLSSCDKGVNTMLEDIKSLGGEQDNMGKHKLNLNDDDNGNNNDKTNQIKLDHGDLSKLDKARDIAVQTDRDNSEVQQQQQQMTDGVLDQQESIKQAKKSSLQKNNHKKTAKTTQNSNQFSDVSSFSSQSLKEDDDDDCSQHHSSLSNENEQQEDKYQSLCEHARVFKEKLKDYYCSECCKKTKKNQRKSKSNCCSAGSCQNKKQTQDSIKLLSPRSHNKQHKQHSDHSHHFRHRSKSQNYKQQQIHICEKQQSQSDQNRNQHESNIQSPQDNQVMSIKGQQQQYQQQDLPIILNEPRQQQSQSLHQQPNDSNQQILSMTPCFQLPNQYKIVNQSALQQQYLPRSLSQSEMTLSQLQNNPNKSRRPSQLKTEQMEHHLLELSQQVEELKMSILAKKQQNIQNEQLLRLIPLNKVTKQGSNNNASRESRLLSNYSNSQQQKRAAIMDITQMIGTSNNRTQIGLPNIQIPLSQSNSNGIIVNNQENNLFMRNIPQQLQQELSTQGYIIRRQQQRIREPYDNIKQDEPIESFQLQIPGQTQQHQYDQFIELDHQLSERELLHRNEEQKRILEERLDKQQIKSSSIPSTSRRVSSQHSIMKDKLREAEEIISRCRKQSQDNLRSFQQKQEEIENIIQRSATPTNRKSSRDYLNQMRSLMGSSENIGVSPRSQFGQMQEKEDQMKNQRSRINAPLSIDQKIINQKLNFNNDGCCNSPSSMKEQQQQPSEFCNKHGEDDGEQQELKQQQQQQYSKLFENSLFAYSNQELKGQQVLSMISYPPYNEEHNVAMNEPDQDQVQKKCSYINRTNDITSRKEDQNNIKQQQIQEEESLKQHNFSNAIAFQQSPLEGKQLFKEYVQNVEDKVQEKNKEEDNKQRIEATKCDGNKLTHLSQEVVQSPKISQLLLSQRKDTNSSTSGNSNIQAEQQQQCLNEYPKKNSNDLKQKVVLNGFIQIQDQTVSERVPQVQDNLDTKSNNVNQEDRQIYDDLKVQRVGVNPERNRKNSQEFQVEQSSIQINEVRLLNSQSCSNQCKNNDGDQQDDLNDINSNSIGYQQPQCQEDRQDKKSIQTSKKTSYEGNSQQLSEIDNINKDNTENHLEEENSQVINYKDTNILTTTKTRDSSVDEQNTQSQEYMVENDELKNNRNEGGSNQNISKNDNMNKDQGLIQNKQDHHLELNSKDSNGLSSIDQCQVPVSDGLQQDQKEKSFERQLSINQEKQDKQYIKELKQQQEIDSIREQQIVQIHHIKKNKEEEGNIENSNRIQPEKITDNSRFSFERSSRQTDDSYYQDGNLGENIPNNNQFKKYSKIIEDSSRKERKQSQEMQDEVQDNLDQEINSETNRVKNYEDNNQELIRKYSNLEEPNEGNIDNKILLNKRKEVLESYDACQEDRLQQQQNQGTQQISEQKRNNDNSIKDKEEEDNQKHSKDYYNYGKTNRAYRTDIDVDIKDQQQQKEDEQQAGSMIPSSSERKQGKQEHQQNFLVPSRNNTTKNDSKIEPRQEDQIASSKIKIDYEDNLQKEREDQRFKEDEQEEEQEYISQMITRGDQISNNIQNRLPEKQQNNQQQQQQLHNIQGRQQNTSISHSLIEKGEGQQTVIRDESRRVDQNAANPTQLEEENKYQVPQQGSKFKEVTEMKDNYQVSPIDQGEDQSISQDQKNGDNCTYYESTEELQQQQNVNVIKDKEQEEVESQKLVAEQKQSSQCIQEQMNEVNDGNNADVLDDITRMEDLGDKHGKQDGLDGKSQEEDVEFEGQQGQHEKNGIIDYQFKEQIEKENCFNKENISEYQENQQKQQYTHNQNKQQLENHDNNIFAIQDTQQEQHKKLISQKQISQNNNEIKEALPSNQTGQDYQQQQQLQLQLDKDRQNSENDDSIKKQYQQNMNLLKNEKNSESAVNTESLDIKVNQNLTQLAQNTVLNQSKDNQLHFENQYNNFNNSEQQLTGNQFQGEPINNPFLEQQNQGNIKEQEDNKNEVTQGDNQLYNKINQDSQNQELDNEQIDDLLFGSENNIQSGSSSCRNQIDGQDNNYDFIDLDKEQDQNQEEYKQQQKKEQKSVQETQQQTQMVSNQEVLRKQYQQVQQDQLRQQIRLEGEQQSIQQQNEDQQSLFKRKLQAQQEQADFLEGQAKEQLSKQPQQQSNQHIENHFSDVYEQLPNTRDLQKREEISESITGILPSNEMNTNQYNNQIKSKDNQPNLNRDSPQKQNGQIEQLNVNQPARLMNLNTQKLTQNQEIDTISQGDNITKSNVNESQRNEIKQQEKKQQRQKEDQSDINQQNIVKQQTDRIDTELEKQQQDQRGNILKIQGDEYQVSQEQKKKNNKERTPNNLISSLSQSEQEEQTSSIVGNNHSHQEKDQQENKRGDNGEQQKDIKVNKNNSTRELSNKGNLSEKKDSQKVIGRNQSQEVIKVVDSGINNKQYTGLDANPQNQRQLQQQEQVKQYQEPSQLKQVKQLEDITILDKEINQENTLFNKTDQYVNIQQPNIKELKEVPKVISEVAQEITSTTQSTNKLKQNKPLQKDIQGQSKQGQQLTEDNKQVGLQQIQQDNQRSNAGIAKNTQPLLKEQSENLSTKQQLLQQQQEPIANQPNQNNTQSQSSLQKGQRQQEKSVSNDSKNEKFQKQQLNVENSKEMVDVESKPNSNLISSELTRKEGPLVNTSNSGRVIVSLSGMVVNQSKTSSSSQGYFNGSPENILVSPFNTGQIVMDYSDRDNQNKEVEAEGHDDDDNSLNSHDKMEQQDNQESKLAPSQGMKQNGQSTDEIQKYVSQYQPEELIDYQKDTVLPQPKEIQAIIQTELVHKFIQHRKQRSESNLKKKENNEFCLEEKDMQLIRRKQSEQAQPFLQQQSTMSQVKSDKGNILRIHQGKSKIGLENDKRIENDKITNNQNPDYVEGDDELQNQDLEQKMTDISFSNQGRQQNLQTEQAQNPETEYFFDSKPHDQSDIQQQQPDLFQNQQQFDNSPNQIELSPQDQLDISKQQHSMISDKSSSSFSKQQFSTDSGKRMLGRRSGSGIYFNGKVTSYQQERQRKQTYSKYIAKEEVNTQTRLFHDKCVCLKRNCGCRDATPLRNQQQLKKFQTLTLQTE